VRALVATGREAPLVELRDDVSEPDPGPSEALVRVRAFAPNRGELTLLRTRGEGWRPGQDLVGEVVRAAADGSGPAEGERVAGLADQGGWAELAAVPAHRLAAVPNAVGDATAAVLPMAGTTALNLVRRGGSLLGRRVLVTGASGGVGHLAVQLAALAGAEVTAVARPERAEAVRARGAAHVVAEVAGAEEGQHLVLESLGGRSLEAAIGRVAAGGVVQVFGNSSREPAPLDFRAFAGREARIESYFSHEHEADAGLDLRILLDLLAQGRLHVDVGLEERWERAQGVLEALDGRRFSGKAALRVT
jgi:NADPH:quinone reductase-like Zn-dependent oxidoreductase